MEKSTKAGPNKEKQPLKNLTKVFLAITFFIIVSFGAFFNTIGVKYLEEELSQRLKSEIEIDRMFLKIFKGELAVKGISISDKDDEVIALQKLRINISLLDLLSKKLVIQELELADIRINTKAFDDLPSKNSENNNDNKNTLKNIEQKLKELRVEIKKFKFKNLSILTKTDNLLELKTFSIYLEELKLENNILKTVGKIKLPKTNPKKQDSVINFIVNTDLNTGDYETLVASEKSEFDVDFLYNESKINILLELTLNNILTGNYKKKEWSLNGEYQLKDLALKVDDETGLYIHDFYSQVDKITNKEYKIAELKLDNIFYSNSAIKKIIPPIKREKNKELPKGIVENVSIYNAQITYENLNLTELSLIASLESTDTINGNWKLKTNINDKGRVELTGFLLESEDDLENKTEKNTTVIPNKDGGKQEKKQEESKMMNKKRIINGSYNLVDIPLADISQVIGMHNFHMDGSIDSRGTYDYSRGEIIIEGDNKSPNIEVDVNNFKFIGSDLSTKSIIQLNKKDFIFDLTDSSGTNINLKMDERMELSIDEFGTEKIILKSLNKKFELAGGLDADRLLFRWKNDNAFGSNVKLSDVGLKVKPSENKVVILAGNLDTKEINYENKAKNHTAQLVDPKAKISVDFNKNDIDIKGLDGYLKKLTYHNDKVNIRANNIKKLSVSEFNNNHKDGILKVEDYMLGVDSFYYTSKKDELQIDSDFVMEGSLLLDRDTFKLTNTKIAGKSMVFNSEQLNFRVEEGIKANDLKAMHHKGKWDIEGKIDVDKLNYLDQKRSISKANLDGYLVYNDNNFKGSKVASLNLKELVATLENGRLFKIEELGNTSGEINNLVDDELDIWNMEVTDLGGFYIELEGSNRVEIDTLKSLSGSIKYSLDNLDFKSDIQGLKGFNYFEKNKKSLEIGGLDAEINLIKKKDDLSMEGKIKNSNNLTYDRRERELHVKYNSLSGEYDVKRVEGLHKITGKGLNVGGLIFADDKTNIMSRFLEGDLKVDIDKRDLLYLESDLNSLDFSINLKDKWSVTTEEIKIKDFIYTLTEVSGTDLTLVSPVIVLLPQVAKKGEEELNSLSKNLNFQNVTINSGELFNVGNNGKFKLDDLDVQIINFTTNKNKEFKITGDFNYNNLFDLEIASKGKFLENKTLHPDMLYLDGMLNIKGFDLTKVNDKLNKILPNNIEAGLLNSKTNFTLNNNYLQSQNNIQIKELSLGSPTDAILNVPFRAATVALRNRDGEINISTNINGNIGELEVNIPLIILNSMVTTIRSSILKPDKALDVFLASRPSSEYTLYFDYGEEVLQQSETGKLTALKKNLQKDPNLQVRIALHTNWSVEFGYMTKNSIFGVFMLKFDNPFNAVGRIMEKRKAYLEYELKEFSDRVEVIISNQDIFLPKGDIEYKRSDL